MSTVINAMQNADSRNSSFLPFSLVFKGNSLWHEPTALSGNPQPAQQLAVYKTNLVISYDGFVNIRDRGTGKSIWTGVLTQARRFSVIDSGIETLTHSGYYELLKYDGNRTVHIPMPFLAGDVYLYYSSFVGNEIRYCFQISPQQTSGPDDPVRGPGYQFIRYQQDKNSIAMRYSGTGFLLDVLHDEKKDRLCIVTDDAFRLLPCNAGSEHDVQILTLEKIYRASLDPEGNIVAVLREKDDGKGNVKPPGLARLDAHGSPVWFCPVDSPQTVIQPPAAMSPDLTYLLVASELWRIEKGKQIWRFELSCAWQDARMTVLADESVLVAAGHALIQIAKNGKEINRTITADKITCRPAVDELGNIYVAGIGAVMCLK